MSSVQIRDVRKSFGGFEVLHGVSIPIEDGAFVVLVGPSGCGKSTLLRMLAGLENITSGTISIGDRVVNNVQPKERDIAMVFQNYALYPHMTVADNMAFSLKLRGASADEINKGVQRAAEILALTPLLDRYPRQLSGGQRQRVAMGRAIVRDPQVFLFDEPLSNLDAKLRVAMRTEIKELHQRHIDRGGLQPLMQILDFGAHRHPQLGVEVRKRLIEQEHLRVAHDGPPHRDALALSTGQLPGIAIE